jgi:hypothetical protein
VSAQGTVARLLEIVGREVGYHEGRNNDNKYAAIAGHANHRAWCDTFCVAAAKMAGVTGVPNSAYCPSSEAAYKAAGRLHTTPRVGDQFFVYIHSEGTVGHTGWVTGVAAGGRSVYTIEGNSNTNGSPEGIEVVRRVRPVLRTAPYSGIRSYGRPTYRNGAPTSTRPKPAASWSISVNSLQKAVRVAADGQWGTNTDRAINAVRTAAMNGTRGLTRDDVRTLQSAVGATRDGVVGPNTRSALAKTVKVLQAVLHVAPDGAWGPITEAAFARAKAKYHLR